MFIKGEKLRDKDFLEKTKSIIEDVINEDRFREAYDLSKILEKSIREEKDFKEKYYDLYRQYWEIIIKLKWVGLPIMVEKDVVNMFKYHLKQMFFIPDYDIFSKLKIVLLGIIIFEDRDKLKKKLRQVIIDNQEKLTSKRIIIDKQKKEPTVANWLRDYNKTLGTGEVDSIKRTQYLTDSKNIRNLAQEEKNKVRTLFDLYEKLKLSSQTLEGLEDDIPIDEDYAKGVIKQGVFEPIKETKEQRIVEEILKKEGVETRKEIKDKSREEGKEEKNKLEELHKMLNQYPEGSLERKAVEEEIRKLKGKS